MNNSRPLIGYIDIQNLKIYAHHGVDPQENVVGNYFEVNVNLAFPCADAMADDDLAHTINYAEVTAIIQEQMSITSKLLENVVYRIYKALTARYPQITSGEISLYKLNPPIRAEIDKAGFTYRW
ncbi:MAG: dihydroneopterin aldolase [Bacteroidales bacterium]|nr:dihydroneopterin aldolase [Bacteroidales bacterium]